MSWAVCSLLQVAFPPFELAQRISSIIFSSALLLTLVNERPMSLLSLGVLVRMSSSERYTMVVPASVIKDDALSHSVLQVFASHVNWPRKGLGMVSESMVGVSTE